MKALDSSDLKLHKLITILSGIERSADGGIPDDGAAE